MDVCVVSPTAEAMVALQRELEALGARVQWVSAPPPSLPPGVGLVVLVEPAEGGLGWCRQLAGSAPLLVLTRRERSAELAALLEAGASDFLTWPRDAAQLRARVQACLRHAAPTPARAPLWQEDVEALLGAWPGLIFLLGPDGTFLRTLAPGERGYFVPPAEFIGRRLGDVLPDTAATPLLEAVERCVRTGSLQHTRYELPAAGGARTFHAILCPGGGGRLVGLVEDVTEQVRAQEALHESEEKYRLLFSLGLEAICLMELGTWRYLDVNDAWVRLYGWSREEAVGRMGPADVSLEPRETSAFLAQAEASGQTCHVVRMHRTREGREFRAAVNVRAFSWRGRPVLMAVLRDVTEREQLEAQLRQADRLASVGTLAAGVAHELNNPLAYVLANLELLASGRLQEEAGQGAGEQDGADTRELLAEALEGARRMRSIVDDLKTFSRPDDSGTSPVDAREVAEASLRLLSNELRYRAVLTRDFRDTPPARANPSRLGQVLVNLLTNALQAMPGSRPAEVNRVTVAVRPGLEGEVVVEVRDNGVGMPPEVQRRIFDPFFTTKPVGVGTGLGLAISHSIVMGLGGRLEVESAPGEGSLFRVVLPAAPAVAAASVVPGPLPVRPPAPGRPLRVLLVEDERNLALTLQHQLAPEVELVAVHGGAEGLARVRGGEHFDAVVCDLMMPGMSGMDFLAELEREDGALAARTGFITGGAFTPRAKDFTRARADRVLEKPFRVEELLALLQGLVGGALRLPDGERVGERGQRR